MQQEDFQKQINKHVSDPILILSTREQLYFMFLHP